MSGRDENPARRAADPRHNFTEVPAAGDWRAAPVLWQSRRRSARFQSITLGYVSADACPKDPGKNKVCLVGVEAPARQGARSAHTGRMSATSNAAVPRGPRRAWFARWGGSVGLFEDGTRKGGTI